MEKTKIFKVYLFIQINMFHHKHQKINITHEDVNKYLNHLRTQWGGELKFISNIYLQNFSSFKKMVLFLLPLR